MGEQKPLERRVLTPSSVRFEKQLGSNVLLASVKETGQQLVFNGVQPAHGISEEDIRRAAAVMQAVNKHFLDTSYGPITKDNYPICHGVVEIDGQLYLVRDFVPGRSLSHSSPVLTTSILEMGIQILDITAGVNQAGFNLIDFHPSHYMMGKSGKPYDLSLASFYGAEPKDVEQDGLFVRGVPGYRSPLLLRGEQDPNQDTWGVAAIVYDLLTNHVLFEDDQATLPASGHAEYYARQADAMERTIKHGELPLDIPGYRLTSKKAKRGLPGLFNTALSKRGMTLHALREGIRELLPVAVADEYPDYRASK